VIQRLNAVENQSVMRVMNGRSGQRKMNVIRIVQDGNMRSKRISVFQNIRPYTRPKMTTMKTLTFQKTITVYVAQCLTFEQFKETYMWKCPLETREEFDERCINVWDRMWEKADKYGGIDVKDKERDDDTNDYNCEDDIKEMVEKIEKEVNEEED